MKVANSKRLEWGETMTEKKSYKNRIYEHLIKYDFTDKPRAFYAYCEQMLNRTQQMFEYDGLPETIPAAYMELQLQVYGFAVIIKHSGNLYSMIGGLGGTEKSPYYQPTFCTVSNPALLLDKTYYFDVENANAVLIRNDIMMTGIQPIISRYASALVENDISLDMMSKNMRATIFINAPNDDIKKAADKFIEDLSNGKQTAVGGDDFLSGISVFPMGGTAANRITDLIEYEQYLRAGLYNELGLQSSYNMKRERLNTAEASMNDDMLIPLIDQMLKQREQGIEKMNAMYGTNVSVKLSGIWETVYEETMNPDPDPDPEEPAETEPEKGGENDDKTE